MNPFQRSATVSLTTCLLGLAACSGNPAPQAPPPAGVADTAAAAAPAEEEPGGLPAASIDPRPRGLAVAELPEPGVELRDPSDRAGLDVTHYDLDVDLGGLADSVLVGHATLTMRLAAGGDHVDLDFVGLPVDSVRVDGRRVAFAQGPAILRVAPEAAFGPEARVEVFYHGVPRDGLFIGPNTSGELTAFADNWPNRARWWFPANDYPPDKATATFQVRAPDGYSVVANGRLVSHENGVWRWREDIEIPAYTMVIGAAPFERADIGTAACGAAPVGAADGCALVSTWALPGSGAYAEQRFARAPDMVDFYTETFGPYPYEKLAHVQSSTRFGGMENSSAIFYAMGGWAEERMGESVIAHETVHQWFGDSVTPASWAHLWVSEGFATYFGALYFGERDGPEAFREAMDGGKRSVIGSDASNRPVIDERSDLFGLLNSNSYPKGAWILHMLRSMIGDEAFFRGIRSYYAQHAEGAADTEDVRRAMEEASGEDLEWFFRQWAYSPGFPRLKVTTQASGAATLVAIEQVQKPEWPTFRLPLVLEIRGADGSTGRREFTMEGRREILRLPGTVSRDAIALDPDDTLLLEVLGTDAEGESAGS
jgi:aminopeptidase N